MKTFYSYIQLAAFALVLAALLIPTLAIAQAKKLVADKSKSTVTYAATHPMHDWEGINHTVSSALMYDTQNKTVQSVAVLLSVAKFDSQNANRDSHMIEVLEGLKYPNITFSSSAIKQNGNKLTVSGTLTFHGVSKAISFDATQSQDGSSLVFAGSFDISLKDYKVEAPTLMGIATDDLIKLTFKAYYPLN